MGEIPADRRQAPRYPVGLSVDLGSQTGVTRDMSASGVFFETDAPLAPGAPITFSLVLKHAHPNAPILLRCEGEIIRVEARDGRIGVAAAITAHWLEPYDDPTDSV